MTRHTRSADIKGRPKPIYADHDESFSHEEDDGIITHAATNADPLPGTSAGLEEEEEDADSAENDLDNDLVDAARFSALEKQVAQVLRRMKSQSSPSTKGHKRKSPKRCCKSQHRRGGGRKRRRVSPNSSSTDYTDGSDDESGDDGTEDDSPNHGSRRKEEIPRIEFDIETLTGKPPKNPKNKSRVKLKYPRPYMYQLRPKLYEIKDRDCFDNLSYEEYVFGLVRLISSLHKKDDSAKCLLNHFLQVAEDATKYSWEGVHEFTNACFDKVDRKEFTWRCRELIRDERIKLSWIAGAKPKPEPQPCNLFNVGTCTKEDGHVEGDTIMRHRCVICWYAADLK